VARTGNLIPVVQPTVRHCTNCGLVTANIGGAVAAATTTTNLSLFIKVFVKSKIEISSKH
jgi:hypothetical protein